MKTTTRMTVGEIIANFNPTILSSGDMEKLRQRIDEVFLPDENYLVFHGGGLSYFTYVDDKWHESIEDVPDPYTKWNENISIYN